MGSHPVLRTADTRRPTVKHMGIEHRCFPVAMAQQFLNCSNIRAAFKQVCGKGMPEGVAGGPLREPGLHRGVSDGFLHQRFVNLIRIGSDGMINSPSPTMTMTSRNQRGTFSRRACGTVKHASSLSLSLPALIAADGTDGHGGARHGGKEASESDAGAGRHSAHPGRRAANSWSKESHGCSSHRADA